MVTANVAAIADQPAPILSASARRRLLKQAEEARRRRESSSLPALRRTELLFKARVDPENPDIAAFADERVDGDRFEVDGFGTGVRRIPLAARRGHAVVFDCAPGFVLLPGFLDAAEQRALVRCCLRDALIPPNTTSLDPHYVLPVEGLWNQAERELVGGLDPVLIQPRRALEEPARPLSTKREPVDLPPVLTGDERAAERDASVDPPPSANARPTPAAELMRRLRWSNIGRQYHWTTKTYATTPSPSIPDGIADVCRSVASAVPWDEIEGLADEATLQRWQRYEPDAGIINFYSARDALTGHVDHSEVDATAPLVSISLGLDAVFLIGGTTRNVAPLPVRLRSGDALVMAGPSRRAFHSLPRVYEERPARSLDIGAGPDWTASGMADYMRSTRINVNVRQGSAAV